MMTTEQPPPPIRSMVVRHTTGPWVVADLTYWGDHHVEYFLIDPRGKRWCRNGHFRTPFTEGSKSAGWLGLKRRHLTDAELEFRVRQRINEIIASPDWQVLGPRRTDGLR